MALFHCTNSLFDSLRSLESLRFLSVRCLVSCSTLSPSLTCLLMLGVEAPFGRVNFSGGFSINGTVGWLIMESVSPIAFLIVMNSRIGPIFNFADFNSLPSLSSISFLHFLHPLTQMPPARAVLSSLFLLHYLHRAMISSFTNPGRSKMNISVPLSAIWFNWLNGSMMGTFLTNYSSKQENFGLKEGKEWIFVLGVTMFLIGMVCYRSDLVFVTTRD